MQSKYKSGLASDATKLSLSNILSLSINMITIMLLSRFISKFEYGTYSQIQIINVLAVAIFSMGLPNCINYFFARSENKKEKQEFIFVYFFSLSAIFIVVCFLMYLFTPYLKAYFKNDILRDFTLIYSTLPLFTVIIQSNSNLLIAIGKSNKLIILTLLNNFALLLSIIFIKIFNLSFKGYMILYILIQFIYAIYVYISAFSIGEFSSSELSKTINNVEIKSYLKTMLKFSIPLGLGTMISTLSIELDKLVISGLMDTNSLAIYTNASKELPIALIVNSFTAILLPKMSRMYKHKDISGIVAIWHSSICIGFTIMVFFATSIITFAPQVLVFMYSDAYLEGINVFKICTLILILRSTYFGIILNITGNTKYVFYSSLLALATNLVSNFLFFKLFGFIGPAISTVLCISLVNFIQLRFTSKILEMSIKDLFPLKDIFHVLLVNLLLAPIFILLKHLINPGIDIKGIIVSIVLGITWMVVYFMINRKFIHEKWVHLNSYSIQE